MTRHYFSGLVSIIREMDSTDKPVVLEMGPMTVSTLSFLSIHKCKIYFENFNDFLPAYNGPGPIDLDQHIDNYLLHFNDDIKFDVILAWDFLNYLQLESIEKLMHRLHPRCHCETLLHMIRYTGGKIPSKPCEFKIISERELEIQDKILVQRKKEAHSTYNLLKYMSNFSMSNELKSGGFRNPFAEHLLRYKSQNEQRNLFTSIDKQSITQNLKNKSSKRIKKQPGIIHKTPGIKALCKYLKTTNAENILDLGAKVGQNVKFFSRYCEHVYVEDLYSSINWWRSIDKKTESCLSPHALSYKNNIKFDAIIIWDIFNYCTLEQIELIGKQLIQYCHRETKLFAILYSSATIPSKPQHFYLDNEEMVRIVEASHATQKWEKLTIATLFKHLPNFKPSNTYLLQQGMQVGISEYLFQYQVSG